MRPNLKPLLATITVALLAATTAGGAADNTPLDVRGLLSDPDYLALQEALEHEPGFLGLAPSSDGSHTIYLAFEGDPPEGLHLVAPTGWDLQAVGDVGLRPTALPVDGIPKPQDLFGPQPAHHSLPHPDFTDIGGIRPGALLIVGFDNHSANYICSAAFVMEDASKTYLSTAGHCLLPPGKTTTEGSGPHVQDPDDTWVGICVDDCLFGGFLWDLNDFPSDFVFIDGITYARADSPSSVGSDYGLIEIPSSLSSLVEPAMSVWGGPYAQTPLEGTGRVLLHFGNGVTAGSAMPTKARMAISSNDGNTFDTFGALGVIAGGDSGSAITLSQVGTTGLEGWFGLGVITHCAAIISITGAECLPIIVGTTVFRGMEMADDDANLDISIVDA